MKLSLYVNRMLIASLEEEQTELDTCLSKMETTQNKFKDQFHREQLQELSRTEKDFQSLIKEEREKIKELQNQVTYCNVFPKNG